MLRYSLVIVGVLLFSIAIVKKAADTCIIHADKWNAKAAQMLSVSLEVMPERGDILAQNGYENIQTAQDTQGIWRVVEGVLNN